MKSDINQKIKEKFEREFKINASQYDKELEQNPFNSVFSQNKVIGEIVICNN